MGPFGPRFISPSQLVTPALSRISHLVMPSSQIPGICCTSEEVSEQISWTLTFDPGFHWYLHVRIEDSPFPSYVCPLRRASYSDTTSLELIGVTIVAGTKQFVKINYFGQLSVTNGWARIALKILDAIASFSRSLVNIVVKTYPRQFLVDVTNSTNLTCCEESEKNLKQDLGDHVTSPTTLPKFKFLLSTTLERWAQCEHF